MKKKGIIISISLVLIACLTNGAIIKCGEKDREIIITENIREDIKAEEEEVEVLKKKAIEYLNQGNFSEVKEIYNKAILMDRGNKDLYLDIKDEYIKRNMLDDAYYIVKTAIDNKIDVDSMKVECENIKNMFEVINYDYTAMQGNNFQLPAEGMINVNGEEITVPIEWNDNLVSTNSLGNYNYDGINEQYGRRFTVNLEVVYKPLSESKIREMTFLAKKNIDDVMFCKNLDLNNSIVIEDRGEWATSYKYTSKQQIIDALYNYCTESSIYEFLDKYTIEVDNKLYLKIGQAGMATQVEVMQDTMKIEQNEDSIYVSYNAEARGVEANSEYTFIKVDGKWLLNKVWLYC